MSKAGGKSPMIDSEDSSADSKPGRIRRQRVAMILAAAEQEFAVNGFKGTSTGAPRNNSPENIFDSSGRSQESLSLAVI